MKALCIDSVAREVRSIELPGDEHARITTIRQAIGGPLEAAYLWSSGDVLYCDEEGWRHDWPTGFSFLPRLSERILGNGVVVGREVEHEDGWTNLDAAITEEGLRQLIAFFVVRA